jgi:Apea-like HEPN
MSLAVVKEQLGLLVSAAVASAASAGRELRQVRGTALYDSRKDSQVASLEPFAAVEAGIRDLPLVVERYGVNQSHRIALQLVYEYFARANRLVSDLAFVGALWADFVAELEAPAWLTRFVTNLRHFHSEDSHVELGDGVSICGRDPARLADLGFANGILERLEADWGGFGASSFVLVAESSMSKRPDNFIMLDDGGGWLRCARAVGAMRLITSGDVGISAVFCQRVARFDVGIGGFHSYGSSVDTLGTPYEWRPTYRLAYGETYTALARLEKSGYGKAPGNLDLALRAFMSTFDRFPTAMDTKLVDAITALEAVLGSETEIAFRLSFRVASLLASTDAQRASLLKTMKGFYDARSRIVHGGRLGKKHSASLAAVDDLRDLVRRLLRSFVLFAADDARHVDKKFFERRRAIPQSFCPSAVGLCVGAVIVPRLPRGP